MMSSCNLDLCALEGKAIGGDAAQVIELAERDQFQNLNLGSFMVCFNLLLFEIVGCHATATAKFHLN